MSLCFANHVCICVCLFVLSLYPHQYPCLSLCLSVSVSVSIHVGLFVFVCVCYGSWSAGYNFLFRGILFVKDGPYAGWFLGNVLVVYAYLLVCYHWLRFVVSIFYAFGRKKRGRSFFIAQKTYGFRFLLYFIFILLLFFHFIIQLEVNQPM